MAERGVPSDGGKTAVSKTALVLGAAGLFLFIVGVKRKHRLDAERDVAAERENAAERARGDGQRG